MYTQTQSIPDTMKAMVYDRKGPNRMAWVSDYNVPSPGKNQVLVKIASSSINVLDYRIVDSASIFYPFPKKICGFDFAGTIVGIGRNVRHFTVGDKVFGWGSGYSNYTVADSNQIARVPDGIAAEEMGIYPLVGTCAHQILRKHWFDRPNFNVRNMLVIGAAGGVGSSLVQIARALGGPEVKIYGVASGKNVDYVKQIGANDCVDYTSRDFDVARAFPIHSMDLIVDTVSGTPESTDYYHSATLLLKPYGRYVLINSQNGLDWFRSIMTRGCGCNWQRSKFDLFVTRQKKSAQDLQAIARLIQQNKYHLNVADELPLLETPIRKALHNLRMRHIRGKIKIKPTEYGSTEQVPFHSPTAYSSTTPPETAMTL